MKGHSMITLDGQNLFDEQRVEIEAGSIQRSSIEKTAAGLDGVISIDLGQRGRKIKQTGLLRAKSQQQMDEKIRAISAFMDGKTHTLKLSSGDLFENLRMDVFKAGKFGPNGVGIVVSYEIVYTQLVV
jgi:hypothetical protein